LRIPFLGGHFWWSAVESAQKNLDAGAIGRLHSARMPGPRFAAPGLRVWKTNGLPGLSASVFTRASGEGYWQSDSHRVCLNLTATRRWTAQFDRGRTRKYASTLPQPISFTPAGIHARFVHGETTVAQIVQGPEVYRRIAHEFAISSDPIRMEPLVALDDPQIARLVQAIVHEIDSDCPDRIAVDGLNIALSIQIAGHFLGRRAQPLPAIEISAERLRRVIEYVEVHLGDRLSLDELAAVACLSPYHFSRCFRRSMGVSPHRYVIRRRIDRARWLLKQGDLALAEIAIAVGFDSQASFAARFQRDVGLSPGRFRSEGA
jgi:AraC family transcriptional regulator